MIRANSIESLDGQTQVVKFTLADGSNTYRWHGNTPVLSGPALQAHLNGREQSIIAEIEARMAPTTITHVLPDGTEVTTEIPAIGFSDTHSETTLLPVTLDEHRAAKIAEMSATTYAYIAQHMPDWRLNRWRRYWDLAQKVAGGGVLDAVEQAEYDVFPDPGESHESCVQYVPVALQWVAACIAAHSAAGVDVYTAPTIEAVQAVTVAYTEWPL